MENIHVVGKKWLEMVVKRTFRPVTNIEQQSLGCEISGDKNQTFPTLETVAQNLRLA